jgi:hypothetical protein
MDGVANWGVKSVMILPVFHPNISTDEIGGIINRVKKLQTPSG